MAGYTEMVEAKNPALVGTGLALWGWILRLTVGLSFIFLPLVVTSVNPVVDNLGLRTDAPDRQAPFNVQQFQLEHPKSVAFAEANASWLKVLSTPQNAPMAAAANKDPTAANLAALQKAVGPVVFAKALAHLANLNKYVVPYETQLTYLSAHQNELNSLLGRRGQVAQAVAALVLGVRRGHGAVHPDHLLQPGPLEPGSAPVRTRPSTMRTWPRSCGNWWEPGREVAPGPMPRLRLRPSSRPSR